MKNYYEILGVHPDSSPQDIKSAFRKQAKRLHPDMHYSAENARPRESSATLRESAMRLILEAYKILSDAEKRRAYDRELRRRERDNKGFDYHEFLQQRSDDPESQAKLIVYDLLHDLDEEALAIYERSKTFADFRLERWLERGEAMDAEYCIAEEYEKRGKYIKAYQIYKKLIRMELEKPWFRYYFEVVALKFRFLILQKMPGRVDEEDYLDRLDEAIELKIAPRETAQYLRKKVEILLHRGEAEAAEEALNQISLIYPKLAGFAALRSRVQRAVDQPLAQNKIS
ncbi:MAG: J domain-containing protein [Spirochaetota bacterium]|jgi:curved DNA-binding protein CbpA|uniref:Putative Chaperone protein DnaJ n=1 Tax=uncultured spirochete TaxID=156406 RepID=A0A3P3XFE7_9SPIR|nr:DnaJ domain-containing protein [Rectinema subterraneum]SLM09812.1 putative Chaperone protein DnaJ [uncultured spirochete]HBE46868.1 molecular chaperone DnaJ [Spirochaetaceae bacterium]HCX96666.1 molecular chaperone DnaJ [Spirochaetaceae bacterium]